MMYKIYVFNNRLALKDSFGMDYSKLFPGSIFNPIRRTSHHLLREDDLSTSFNISSVEIY